MSSKKEKKFDLEVLKRLLRLAMEYKALFFSCLLVTIIIAPLGAVLPYLVKVMVDDYIVVNDLTGLYKTAGIFIAVLLSNVVLRYFLLYYIALLGQSVVKNIRVKVFSHITKLRLRYFDTTPIGTSTTRTINDIQAINEVFTQGVIAIIADMLSVFTVIGIMFYTSWRLTVICLSVLPLLILATYIFKEKVRASYTKVRNQIANMNGFLQERISGMRIVQIFNAQDQELSKFKKINRDYTQANLDSIFYYALFFPAVELISAISLALMVWLGARAFLDENVTFGALVAFPLYLELMYRPIRMAADKFNTLQMGLVAASRVFVVLDSDAIIENKGTLKPTHLNVDIEFKDVSFSYDQENYVLNDINFKILKGQTLAIVGSTGSGKSTIINILSRFYDIQKGQILFDDKPIKDYELEALRSKISIVLQDVFLFDGSVLENITLKDPNISLPDVVHCAKLIGAHEFIEQLPGGYDFHVRERGNNLSVGQRQLISFVRALCFNPDLLILDEATSSIDPETELVIQYAIEKLIDKRTSIIIAHRLSTIKHADNILVLDKGNVVEFGNHHELLKLENGRYRELYDMQFVEEV